MKKSKPKTASNTARFDILVRDYLKQNQGKDHSKGQRLNWWVEQFKNTAITKIKRLEVKNCLDVLAESYAPSTVNRYKTALSAFFVWVSYEFDTFHNPTLGIQALKEKNKKVRYLSHEEHLKLLSACKQSKWDRLYLLVCCAINTGARRSELLNLKWQDINFDQSLVCFNQGKKGDKRTLNLTEETINELVKFKSETGFVFENPTRPQSYFKNFDCHFQKALVSAKIKDFRFHDLRYSCASFLAKNGASLSEIADTLGHKTLSTVGRYSHLCIDQRKNLVDKVFENIANK